MDPTKMTFKQVKGGLMHTGCKVQRREQVKLVTEGKVRFMERDGFQEVPWRWRAHYIRWSKNKCRIFGDQAESVTPNGKIITGE